MRNGSRRRKKISSTQQFLGTLIILSVGSWLCYHAFSYFIVKSELPNAAIAEVNPLTQPTIVSKINLNANNPQNDELLLLANVKRSASSKPTSKPVRVVARNDNSVAIRILMRANSLINDGQTIKARTLLNDSLKGHLTDPEFKSLLNRTVEIGQQTIDSLKIYPGDHLSSYYTIKPGDYLSRIAKRANLPYQFLCRINHISDPGKIRVGQKIKVPEGPVNLKVVKHELMMYVYLQDVLFAKYRVGLGKNDKTPIGTWLIESRIRKPSYVDPDTGRKYDGNDPENPTGGYWLRLKGIEGDALGKTGFGIHGTIEPDSIGKFESKGCVRMRNEEMAEVFDMLSPGLSEVQTLP